MYFIDTNIILEIALKQENYTRAKDFINNTKEKLYISDLSIYSIGIILYRLKKEEAFNLVIDEILSGFIVISIPHKNLCDIQIYAKQFNLDFEDAYQYLLAKVHGLTLVSFDKDFDRVDIKKVKP